MAYIKDRSTKARWSYVSNVYPSWPAHSITRFDSPTFIVSRTRAGVSVQGWKQKIQQGLNATSPLTGVLDSVDVKDGYINATQFVSPIFPIVYSDVIKGTLALNGFTIPAWADVTSSTNAKGRAVVAFLRKVKAVNNSAKGGVILGEIRETLNMIRHPMEGIRNIGNAWLAEVVIRKKKHPKRWTKNLSGAWLEYAFGMAPLIQDVNDLLKAYNRLGEQHKSVPVHAYGADSVLLGNTTTNLDFSSRALGRRNVRLSEKCTVKITGKVIQRAQTTPFEASDMFGFNILEEFLPTAYELLPWSFLLDYFSNVGDIIEAGCTETSSLAWASQSMIVSKVREHRVTGDFARWRQTTPAPINYTSSASSVKWVRRVVQRDTLSALTLPTLTFELPGHPSQWANMTALFAQGNEIHPQVRRTWHR